MAEAQQPSCTDATSGAHVQAHEPTKRKRRKRNRKNSHVPTHEVLVITGESVEERKERLSEEAERAGVQAHAPDVVHIADDEDTEDDEAFKEQELLRKAQEKIHAKYMDRLARVKIDRYRLVGMTSC